MLLLLTLLFFGELTYEDPEIYEQFDNTYSDVDEDGYLYVSALTAGSIIRYDPQGRIVARMGRKGNGPGEFQFLIAFSYCNADQRIYAADVKKPYIDVFSREGKHLATVKKPEGMLIPSKTATGWLYREQRLETAELGLLTLADDFGQPKELQKWVSPTLQTSGITLDREGMRVSKDDRYAFISRAGRKDFEILILDTDTNQFQTFHHKAIKAMVMEKEYRELVEPKQVGPVPFEIGEKVPFVKWMLPWKWNMVLVYYNIHYLNEDVPPLILDAQGQQHKTELTPAQIERTLFVGDNWRIEASMGDDGLEIVKITP